MPRQGDSSSGFIPDIWGTSGAAGKPKESGKGSKCSREPRGGALGRCCPDPSHPICWEKAGIWSIPLAKLGCVPAHITPPKANCKEITGKKEFSPKYLISFTVSSQTPQNSPFLNGNSHGELGYFQYFHPIGSKEGGT